MISEQLSDKLRICSFLATVFVVYRHSFVIHAFYGANICNNQDVMFITHWISGLTEMAVPLFFIISGFFFLGKEYSSWTIYFSMMRKKTRTLFVPFVCWNVAGLFVLLLYKCSAVPHELHSFVKHFFISDFNGPLWYVRDLMLYMLLVPLYQWLFDNRMRVLLGLFVSFLLTKWMPVDGKVFSSEGVLFFIIGGILSKYKVLDYRIDKKWIIWALLFLWQICCLFCDLWSNEWLHKAIVVLGVLALWYGIDLIPIKFCIRIKQISCYAFFIYVTHFYCVKFVKLILAHYFYGNGTVALLTCLLVPMFVIALLIEIGKLFRFYFPKVYLFTTGNR